MNTLTDLLLQFVALALLSLILPHVAGLLLGLLVVEGVIRLFFARPATAVEFAEEN